jgi:ubiquinone/menaquinone biosynthesis C-methylase UbiE
MEHFGYEQVTAEEKTRRVRGVFDSVAGRYDLMNDLRLEIKLHGKEAKNRNVFAGIGNMDIVPEQQQTNNII